MKLYKIISCAAACSAAFVFVISTHAALVYDGFSSATYTNGDTVHGVGGGTGWDSNWAVSPADQANRYLASNYSLGYTAPNTQSLLTTGGSQHGASFGSGAATMERMFENSISGEVWISFLAVRTNDVQTFNWQLAFFDAAQETGLGAFSVQNNSGESKFRLRARSTGATYTNTGSLDLSNLDESAEPQGQLYVLRITNAGSGNDNAEITMWGNPGALAEDFDGTAAATITIADRTIGALTGIGLTKGIDTTSYFDELRVGSSAADVLPIPEPRLYGLMVSLLAFGWFALRKHRCTRDY